MCATPAPFSVPIWADLGSQVLVKYLFSKFKSCLLLQLCIHLTGLSSKLHSTFLPNWPYFAKHNSISYSAKEAGSHLHTLPVQKKVECILFRPFLAAFLCVFSMHAADTMCRKKSARPLFDIHRTLKNWQKTH